MSKVICIAGESGSGKTTSMEKVYLGKVGKNNIIHKIKIIMQLIFQMM